MPTDGVGRIPDKSICACMHYFSWDRKWKKQVTHDMSSLVTEFKKNCFSVVIGIYNKFITGLILLLFVKKIFTFVYISTHTTLP